MLSLFADIAVVCVVVLHAGFLVLEMFLWNTPTGHRIFRLKPEFAEKSASLAANQGLYNGFLAAGLVWGLFYEPARINIFIFFLCCVLIAGIYGAFTVNRMIFWLQAFPAIIALVLLFLAQSA